MNDGLSEPDWKFELSENGEIVEVRWRGGIDFHRNYHTESQAISTIIDDAVQEFKEHLQATIMSHFA